MEVRTEKRWLTVLFSLATVIFLSTLIVYSTQVDIRKPYHILQQIAISENNLVSIDADNDGRIDEGLTQETLQSITNNGATTDKVINLGGINSAGSITVGGKIYSSGGLEVSGGEIKLGNVLYVDTTTGVVEANGKICLNGDCKDDWPYLQTFYVPFITGLLYPYGSTDPFLRDNQYPYPYTTLCRIISLYGVNSTNPYATNWFPIGYNYWQPWTQKEYGLYLMQGDNIRPVSLYNVNTPPFTPNDPNDIFHSCDYETPEGVFKFSNNRDFCYSCAQNPNSVPSCERIVRIRYVDVSSNVKGNPFFEIKLVPYWQSDRCKRTYKFGDRIRNWGDPRVISTFTFPSSIPDVSDDPCYGANIHSVIKGRFVIQPLHGLRDPIRNFCSNNDFTVSIKEAGVYYVVRKA